MTASELNRKLLYRGYDDIIDHLRNSPVNRSVYNVLLQYTCDNNDISLLPIFNEVYYQFVRINMDATPGVKLRSRYLDEATEWLGSRESALLVFNVVWALLRRKFEKSFNEECFVRRFYRILEEGDNERIAYIIIKYISGDRLMPSKKYRPMPIQIDELTSIENEAVDGDVWNEVTNGFSRTTIENLICLYSTPEEQTQLLEIIENHCSNSASKSNKAKFTAIRNGIIEGKYKRPDIDNDPEYSEGMELTYKEELEEFKARYKFMEEGYKRKIENLSYAYREDLSEIKKKLEKKALRRELKDDPSIRLFTFTEMAEIAKTRFSKTAAEEFSNMLYNLSLKHGFLDEEFSQAIDDIVPSVLKREALHQTIEIPEAGQVVINPQQVINRGTEKDEE